MKWAQAHRNHLAWTVVLVLALSARLQAQGQVTQENLIALPQELLGKIADGRLIEIAGKRIASSRAALLKADAAAMTVVLYFASYPAADEISALSQLGIRCRWETWTPPLPNHPLGFVVASIPASRFVEALSLPFVARMGSAERARSPMNNLAAQSIGAGKVWAKGVSGNGVRVAILDSGLDTDPGLPDIPVPLVARDYSLYPTSIGTTVRNKVTPHGTHVTGTLLGRGFLSDYNPSIGNGDSSYKGMAFGAGLVFLKIGDDSTAGATDAAIIGAAHAAVDSFGANVVSMSYGSWGVYHDGSDPDEQLADYVYSKGAPWFIAAGNDAARGWHFSGTVGANDSTSPISVVVSGALAGVDTLLFNLVWWAPPESTATSLLLHYYTSSNAIMAATVMPTTTSPRGTKSQYSQADSVPPAGSGNYSLRVVNTSPRAQFFHLYMDNQEGSVFFLTPDPSYTINYPASADHAFAVAADVSRMVWTAYDGSLGEFFATSVGAIAPFSSLGPRVDGHLKPDITTPGTAVISVRDRDVATTPSTTWVSSIGISGPDTAYLVGAGTSMATPVAAGAAALLRSAAPTKSPQQVYDALSAGAVSDAFTGSVPNNTWGAGKLDVNASLGILTAVVASTSGPARFGLSQNYPNPFNPSTTIQYEIPSRAKVLLEVYNLLGQRVATLVNGDQQPGIHQVQFSASALASGVYFYRLRSGDFVQTRKLVLLR
ncbi:MAG TPA: S8/S53 family peptidase [Bacteroidota bacterium]|nr:S8/S53 family peptidase [Bacteroidota bacterium]